MPSKNKTKQKNIIWKPGLVSVIRSRWVLYRKNVLVLIFRVIHFFVQHILPAKVMDNLVSLNIILVLSLDLHPVIDSRFIPFHIIITCNQIIMVSIVPSLTFSSIVTIISLTRVIMTISRIATPISGVYYT